MASNRDFDTEAADQPERRYAYDFDYRVHGYMMRTFGELFVQGGALELGCYRGHFTTLLADSFPELDVVDASRECIAAASAQVPGRVRFHHSMFEEFSPPARFANIFLIHTLEHLDRPVDVLRRIASWLTPDGRLFIATPNAYAASRQIAVSMRLIEQEEAVTAAEKAHGHRKTYSLETLGDDIEAAGLTIEQSGGVILKALANFQMDKAMESEIISDAYLDGCYEVGKRYPELCASIYFVCAA